MGFTLTVAEAAKRLGVSVGRIYQLIDAKALQAEKFGRVWMVDEMSVAARAATPVPAGRPTRAAAVATREFVLMNRTHEVLAFECDPQTATFTTVTAVYDMSRAPLCVVSPRGKTASVEALRFWWMHRAIPGTRTGFQERLRELGICAEELPFGSLGLSLSDQYWVRPKESSALWEDVNYFTNDFDLAQGGWLASVGLSSPDNTSEGELPKKWVLEGGRRVLLKGAGPLGQEPLNELLATNLHRRVLEPGAYVPYEVRMTDDGPVSACTCFLRDDEEYIPAYYVRQLLKQPNHLNGYRHFIECCAFLGIEDAETALSKMIVCDDIIANHDRHLRNFGIVRNVETLECRMAPLFDSGSSLWCDVPTAALKKGVRTFSAKPFYEDANRQLRLVDDYDWLDMAALVGFDKDVERVLAETAETRERAGYVADAVRWRIRRIANLLA